MRSGGGLCARRRGCYSGDRTRCDLGMLDEVLAAIAERNAALEMCEAHVLARAEHAAAMGAVRGDRCHHSLPSAMRSASAPVRE